MPLTPDRKPGAADEEATLYEATSLSTLQGEVRYDGSRFSMFDSVGEFDPRSGGGISQAQHETLDTLVHNIAETNFLEVVRSAGKVTDVIHWTNSSKTTKVREVNISRSAGKVSSIVLKQYDGAGALVTNQTLTGTVARSGGRVASIDWVES